MKTETEPLAIVPPSDNLFDRLDTAEQALDRIKGGVALLHIVGEFLHYRGEVELAMPAVYFLHDTIGKMTEAAHDAISSIMDERADNLRARP